MTDLSPIAWSAVCGAIAAVMGRLIFRPPLPEPVPRFGLWPDSTTEWRAWWFHTLELGLFGCLLLAFTPAAGQTISWRDCAPHVAAISIICLLLLSAAICRRSAPALARAAVRWSVYSLLILGIISLFPMMPTGRTY